MLAGTLEGSGASSSIPVVPAHAGLWLNRVQERRDCVCRAKIMEEAPGVAGAVPHYVLTADEVRM